VCAGRSPRIQGETQYIDYRVIQRQLKLEEDTGAIDPYTLNIVCLDDIAL
jgi:hypothetical protein